MKDLVQMIEEINKAVNETLSITHYSRWTANSYGEESLFLYSNKGEVQADSFTELIEKVYKVVKEESNGAK